MNFEPETLSPETGMPEVIAETPSDERSSYRQIFKATSIFGGVQVFNILIGIVSVKFVAILLGTTGVGIIGLLNAPLNLIISITGLGIAFSAIRDVSEANGTRDKKRISKSITTLRKWSWFTGLLGAVVTFSLAPLLSQWSFGNREYTWSFVWLSVTLLLQAISKGQRAILQGTQRLQDMAKAGVIGSALGLVTSIPLYYWYGVKGIVPALLVTAITSLFLSWYFSRRVLIEKINFTYKEIYISGLGMAKLGIFMTLAGFMGSLSGYVLNAFISARDGVEMVGLYNAGWGVVGQYTGLIFAAMATDYFPRLSAINNDDEKIKVLVEQQGETALLIMTPLLALLIISMPLVIRIIYTPAFLPIAMFANLTVLGMQFKAVSWAMGYVYLAKGNGKLFLFLELGSGSIVILMNLLFYSLFGLNGLGISFIITFFFGMVLSYSVLKWKYHFSFPGSFFRKLSLMYGIVILSFLTVFIPGLFSRYLVGIIVLISTTIFSLIRLDTLMDLRSYISEVLKGYPVFKMLKKK